MKFPRTFTLETKRCSLRFISKDDIPHIFEASQSPGFTDGMLWEPPKTEAELIEPYIRNVKSWEEDHAYCFTIETKQTTEFVGRIVIREKKEEGNWNLGFWTHPNKQGMGHMTEAVARVIEFGFEELMASHIHACYALWNTASKRVLEKNGMVFIEHHPKGFQKNGKWVEENLLGISVEKWRAEPVAGGDATR